MKKFVLNGLIGIGLILMFACKPVPATVTDATATISKGSTSVSEDTVTPTIAPQSTKVVSKDTQEPPLFPLSEPGPYFPGSREYRLIDHSRDWREIGLTIWYPALEQTDADGRSITYDAAADLSSAPYPLILTGHDSGRYLFKSHLASHGFVMAIIQFPEYYDNWDYGVIDHPQDMLFALDQIASNTLEGLEGVIDADNVGVAGYSWDGFFSLAVSGGRIDPQFYLSQCAEAASMEPPLDSFWLNYYCNLSNKWDEFEAYAGLTLNSSDDGLWQPITDDRIRAVAPLAPDGAWLYGERGLAAVDRPTLIIVGTEDRINDYSRESVYIFEHLGTPERYMISFIGKNHTSMLIAESAKRMNHFVTAFFAHYLKGRSEYRDYFSEDFVSQFDDLAWGIYK
jgi:predicted dienelactone hydrolase